MRTGCAKEFRARCQAAARAPEEARREQQRHVAAAHNKVMSILGNAKRVNFWYAILWARPREGGGAAEGGRVKLHN